MAKYLKPIIITSAVLLALVLLFVFIVNLIVVIDAEKSIVQSNELPQNAECIVVLGAGIKNDGTPSDMLSDRLDIAISLYNDGVAQIIILSGDCSGEEYDEVGAMLDYCIAKGVPDDALIRDNTGYSTYESMNNVINSMQYGKFIVVTQEYHLYRAVYIARKMGAEAYGVASDPRQYRGQVLRSVREYAARVKDALQVEFCN